MLLQATVDCLEDSVRRLGQHNAHLVQQIKGTIVAADSNTTGGITAALAGAGAAMHTPMSAPTAAAGAAPSSMNTGASSCGGAMGSKLPAAQAGAAPMSSEMVHSIIAAATRVNEKNKKLKRQLQLALQGNQA